MAASAWPKLSCSFCCQRYRSESAETSSAVSTSSPRSSRYLCPSSIACSTWGSARAGSTTLSRRPTATWTACRLPGYHRGPRTARSAGWQRRYCPSEPAARRGDDGPRSGADPAQQSLQIGCGLRQLSSRLKQPRSLQQEGAAQAALAPRLCLVFGNESQAIVEKLKQRPNIWLLAVFRPRRKQAAQLVEGCVVKRRVIQNDAQRRRGRLDIPSLIKIWAASL